MIYITTIILFALVFYIWMFSPLETSDRVGITTAISMVALFIVTSIYAWHTRKMADEMKNQRYDAVRPVIDIRWQALEGARRLGELASSPAQLASEGCSCVLRNVGLGPAIDAYSFVRSPSGERQVYDFGTLPVEREAQLLDSFPTFPTILSPRQDADRIIIEIHYKDVYGREFESSREIVGKSGDWKLGPLKVCPLPKKE